MLKNKILQIYGVPEHLYELLGSLDVPPQSDENEIKAKDNIEKAQFRYDMLSINDCIDYNDVALLLQLNNGKLQKLERQERGKVIVMFRSFFSERFNYSIIETDLDIEMNWQEFLYFLQFVFYDNEEFFVNLSLSIHFNINPNSDLLKQIKDKWKEIDLYFSSYSCQNKFTNDYLVNCPYKFLWRWCDFFLHKYISSIAFQKTKL